MSSMLLLTMRTLKTLPLLLSLPRTATRWAMRGLSRRTMSRRTSRRSSASALWARSWPSQWWSARAALPGKLANAAAALHLGKFEDAASLYDEALADPKIGHLEPFAVYGKSVALAGKGDTDKALEALNTLAKIDDEYAELAMYKKGTMLEATGDIEGAKEVYHALLEQKPNSAYKLDVERRLATL